MNQVYQMDVFTFYQNGILRVITFGERLFFTSQSHWKLIPNFLEKIRTCNKTFLLMSKKGQERETGKKTGQALNSLRMRMGSKFRVNRGTAYFNTG